MPLRNRNMVKNGNGVTTLSLQAATGKSLLVKDILVAAVADVYLTVKIARTTVGYFRVDTTPLGNHIGCPLAAGPIKSILGFLGMKGIFSGYPIAEGQTLELSGLGATAIIGSIVYDEYDAGDITADMANGTEGPSFLFLNYGVVAANVATATDTLYTASSNPAEFPAFPFGDTVPANRLIRLYGICASERAGDDGSTAANNCLTQFYKLLRGRTVLFDDDLDGILAQGVTVGAGGAFAACNGQSIMGDYTDLYPREPLMFDQPLTFGAGEELLVYVTTEVAGTPGTLLIAELQIALIVEVVTVS